MMNFVDFVVSELDFAELPQHTKYVQIEHHDY